VDQQPKRFKLVLVACLDDQLVEIVVLIMMVAHLLLEVQSLHLEEVVVEDQVVVEHLVDQVVVEEVVKV
tara:strand:- start:516 stop:722 length:207 start_codon:yes stop_codon:yes gene_type:complete